MEQAKILKEVTLENIDGKDFVVFYYEDGSKEQYEVHEGDKSKSGKEGLRYIRRSIKIENFYKEEKFYLIEAKEDLKNCYQISSSNTREITFCDLSFTVCFEPIYFEGQTFTQTANFKSAIFSKTVTFSKAIFKVPANFQETIFSSVAHFRRTIFEKKADFMEASFNEAFFQVATFDKKVDFQKAVFNEANFQAAVFNKKSEPQEQAAAFFQESTFHKKADFSQATFYEEVYFGNSIFNEAIFHKTTFNKKADFQITTFNKADFWETTFNESNFLQATFKKTDFSLSTFNKKADFERTTFKEAADFSNAILKDDAKLSFNQTIFQDILNLSVDLKNLSPKAGIDLVDVVIDSRKLFVPEKLAQKLNPKYSHRQTFTYFKDSMLSRHDTISALEFYRKEYDAYLLSLMRSHKAFAVDIASILTLIIAVIIVTPIAILAFRLACAFPWLGIFLFVILIFIILGMKQWILEAINLLKSAKDAPPPKASADNPQKQSTTSSIILLYLEHIISQYGTAPFKALFWWITIWISFSAAIMLVGGIEISDLGNAIYNIYFKWHETLGKMELVVLREAIHLEETQKKLISFALHPLSIFSDRSFLLQNPNWLWLEGLNFLKTVALAYLTYEVTKSFRKFSRRF